MFWLWKSPDRFRETAKYSARCHFVLLHLVCRNDNHRADGETGVTDETGGKICLNLLRG